jgi:phosphatidylglycerophosphatase A
VIPLARLIATWFYLGYLKAPGTFGTLGGLAVAWAFYQWAGFGPAGFALLAAVFTVPAIWSASVVSRTSGLKDPQVVVVDEVVGVWLALSGARPLNWISFLLAFALFRFFDIWKPAPVRWLEKLPGGTGIVADDLAAGFCAALVLFAAGWFNLY